MVRFFIWRLGLYVLFTFIAAPLQYHTDWITHWSRENFPLARALTEPLAHGELFFYSMILLAEAVFRMASKPELMTRGAVQSFYFLSAVLGIPFLFFLIGGIGRTLGTGWVAVEWYVTGCSLALSVAVYVYLHRIDRIHDPAAMRSEEGAA